MKSLFHRYIPNQGRCELVIFNNDTWGIISHVKDDHGFLHKYLYPDLESACKAFKTWNGEKVPPGIFKGRRTIIHLLESQVDNEKNSTTASAIS